MITAEHKSMLRRSFISVAVMIFVFLIIGLIIMSEINVKTDQITALKKITFKDSGRGLGKDFLHRLELDKERQEILEMRHKVNQKLQFNHPPNYPFTIESPLVILFWHGGMRWSNLGFDSDKKWTSGSKIPISVTYDQSLLKKANIVLFLEYADKEAIANMTSWQASAMLTLEPGLASPNIKKELEPIDILISYNKNSEVIIDYSYSLFGGKPDNCTVVEALNRSGVLGRLPDLSKKRTDALGAFFINNCGSHDAILRTTYLRELLKYIPIHSYGGCMHTEGLEKAPDKIASQSQYRFAFCFENSVMDDYVTEKFYEGFQSDVIPIYLGAPNIAEYLPNRTSTSYINAFDYPDPADLAGFLIHLASNDSEYLKYFEWRMYSIDPVFDAHNNFLNVGQSSFISRMAVWYRNHIKSPFSQ